MAATAVAAAAAITATVVVIDYVASPGESRAETAATSTAPSTSTAPTTAPVSEPVAAPGTPAVDGVFAGRSSGNEMTVAVATRAGQVAAYLCDGESVERGWTAKCEAASFACAAPKGATLSATVTDEAAFMTLTVGGRTLPFSAQLAPPPAGLKRPGPAAPEPGWIVLADGSQVGLSQTNGVSTPARPTELDRVRPERP